MIHLTIGYLSGVIAAIVFVVQFILPNALIVVLVGLLKNKHTAVTWSVVERNLLSSHWPLFLRADSTASQGVDRSIRVLTWIRPLALLLITIAAVCTPLGLYDDVLPDRSTQSLLMVHVPDTGPFGFGTPPREPQFFNRKCHNSSMPAQCPGTTDVFDTNFSYDDDGTLLAGNETWDNIDMRIPKSLAQLYQSGLKDQPGSVSSFFDIQSRQYGYATSNGYMHNKSFITDGFQYLSTVVLNDAIEPFEGLIVDTKSGSIGFRNHTVPDGAGLGAEWSEDLLFIEPETQCVSMNVSLEFRVPTSDEYESLVNITLVDGGGMTDFVQKYPLLDLSDAQRDPQLHNRAYKAGWMTNAYNMLTMNLTRPGPDAFSYVKSHVGARYPLASTQTSAQLNGIYMSSWSTLLDPGPISNYTVADTPTANFSNPFHIDYSNFSGISTICSGAGRSDLTNLSNVHVECGLIFGAARRRDGTETLIFEPGKWYIQPVYSCASATKATIKTVDFRYNATQETGHTLKALTVLNASPKPYKDKASMPLWGVETVDYDLDGLSQFWGIIDPEQINAVNLSAIRSPHLYLPGYSGSLSNSPRGFDNVPGANGPRNLLYAIYHSTDMRSTGLPDYTGTLNYAMLAKWREYSKSHETMAVVMNLIWTDLAANYLMGTRSWNRASDWLPPNLQDPKSNRRQAESVSDRDGQTRVPVQVYQRKIRYHWYFAIPALASLLLVGLVVALALLLMMFGRGTPSRIDHYLVHLSSGRLLGSMQYPSEDKDAPTTEWITRVGCKESDLHRLAAAYNGEVSSGLSPYFKQPTVYGDKGPPPGSDYDPRPIPMGPINPGGKGYMQVSTHEQQGGEIFARAK